MDFFSSTFMVDRLSIVYKLMKERYAIADLQEIATPRCSKEKTKRISLCSSICYSNTTEIVAIGQLLSIGLLLELTNWYFVQFSKWIRLFKEYLVNYLALINSHMVIITRSFFLIIKINERQKSYQICLLK